LNCFSEPTIRLSSARRALALASGTSVYSEILIFFGLNSPGPFNSRKFITAVKENGFPSGFGGGSTPKPGVRFDLVKIY
jgi:hypothetical protein